jgi:hypothetical protein
MMPTGLRRKSEARGGEKTGLELIVSGSSEQGSRGPELKWSSLFTRDNCIHTVSSRVLSRKPPGSLLE